MHANKKVNAQEKAVVLGMLERGGRVRAFVVPSAKTYDLQPSIYANVSNEAMVCTDSYAGYDFLKWTHKHKTVKHCVGEYVRAKDIHTNSIEGFWGTLKRGIYGIYHHVSRKYLQNYVSEFCFRYNNRFSTNTFNQLINQTVYAK